MREENVLRMNFCLHEGQYEISELLKLYNIFLLPLRMTQNWKVFFFFFFLRHEIITKNCEDKKK